MIDVLALLIEISHLSETSNAAWTDDIQVGACKLMQHILSRNCPMHSFVVHDSRRDDCVKIALAMTVVASRADDQLEATKELREKLRSLTSKVLCMALYADNRAILSNAVDKTTATQSLAQQLKL